MLTLLPSSSPVSVSHADCVAVLANRAIRSGSVIIDAGAGDGAWTQAVLAGVSGVEVHCFEPDLVQYRQLLVNLAKEISAGKVVPHNASVGWTDARGGAAWSSLAQYAKFAGLKRLPLVRLGCGVPISAISNGCEEMIRRGQIEFVLASASAAEEAQLVEWLLPHRYELFRHPALSDQVLCASDRFRTTIRGDQPQPLDLLQMCNEFGVSPTGVIHLGAREGHQATRYAEAGIAKSLMVEPDPAVVARLQDNDCNLLYMDIKGAELMVMSGLANVLSNIHAVLTELNFEELFAGSAMIEQVDAFLESQGFERAVTHTPVHAGWGHAFYLRRRPASVPPQLAGDFLCNARNTLVGGWLSIPSASLREAWEGATGVAHRHLIENGVHQLQFANDDDHRVLDLLEKNLVSASKDRRLQLLLALMLYLPAEQIPISTDGIPGWLKTSIPQLGSKTPAMAA